MTQKTWRRVWIRARELARESRLPHPGEKRALLALTLAHRGIRRLAHRILHDRVAARAAALAFQTVLSVVPIAAVAFATVRVVAGEVGQRAVIEVLAERYFPAAATDAIQQAIPLITGIDLRTVGIVGLVALLPIMVSLVAQVEIALSDIFRTPRKGSFVRLAAYAALVTFAPFGAVLTVRYTLRLDALTFFSRHLFPIAVTMSLFYLAFRFLPHTKVRDRGAIAGAALAAALLELSKIGFGIWAANLAVSIRAVWGAVAFVPLLLIWVFLAWFIVLLGAELAAVVHELTEAVLSPIAARPRRAPRSWQRPLRRRMRMRR